MKRFLYKIFLFTFIAGFSYGVILIGLSLKYSRYIDNYSHIIRKHSGSLILGTSRPGTGIDPAALNFPEAPWLPFYNFAGTAYYTPYGPAYLNLIQRKFNNLTPDNRRVFILAVDPWSLWCDKEYDNPKYFPENHTFITQLKDVHSSVNLEFLRRFSNFPLRDMLQALIIRNMGWVDENGKFVYPTSLAECLERQPLRYAESLAMHTADVSRKTKIISVYRMLYLHKTIEYLSAYGRIVLVRMPISDGMQALENKYEPDFSLRMKTLVREHHCMFLDYVSQNQNLIFVDDHHLYNTSAYSFSKILANDININPIKLNHDHN